MAGKLSSDFMIKAAAVAVIAGMVGTMCWEFGLGPKHEDERRSTNQAYLASQGFNLVSHVRSNYGIGRDYMVDCYNSTKIVDDGHLYQTCLVSGQNAVKLSIASDLGTRVDQIKPLDPK